MNIEITFKHLPKWVDEDRYDYYLNCPFKATFFKSKQLLQDELRRVDAQNVTVYTSHPPQQITRDGWPRADRQPPDPGIVLEFDKLTDDGHWQRLRFPCGTFKLWEENLRAIALALEALRKIDRYGVVTGAQYAGFKALPPAEEGSEGQTVEQAADFVAKCAGMEGMGAQVLSNPVFGDLAYKTAAKQLHPDKGGDAKIFQKLESSMRMVRESYEQAQTAGGGA